MVELLSPAGSPDALRAAVASGADAVYLGASGLFSARASARNFDISSIKEHIDYCHERGVRVHAAINTLIGDREMNDALECAEHFANAGVDAFIVQDIGLVSVLQKITDVPLHASTQMTIHSLDGALELEDLGFSRVVLSRELSLKDIAYITSHTKLETEVFVHGALCVCYSGQCYMSSVIGGRSGNRGLCAQPCRLPYDRGYVLSMKDNCLIDHLEELVNCGVSSLKIEGRMKSPEYVGAVTYAYAEALRGRKDENVKDMLAGVFSRDGFTDGYLTGHTGRGMFGRRDENEKADRFKISALEYPRFRLDMSVIRCDDSVRITGFSEDGFSAETSIPCSDAKKAPLSADDAEKSLFKLGNTVYYPGSFSFDAENMFVPVSGLNSARREIIDSLGKMRSVRNNRFSDWRALVAVGSGSDRQNNVKPRTEGYFLKIESVPVSDCGLDRIWIPLTSVGKKEFVSLLEVYGDKIGVFIPPVFHDSEYPEIRKLLDIAAGLGIRRVLCGNIGQIRMCSDRFEVHGDYGLNIYNRLSVRAFTEDFGCESVTLSFERQLAALKSLNNGKTGIIAYGRLPFMIMRNCTENKCRKNEKRILTDRMHKVFPVTCEFGCRNRIWNSDILYLGDRLQDIECFSFIRFIFVDENREDVVKITNTYTSSGDVFIPENRTRGLYYR